MVFAKGILDSGVGKIKEGLFRLSSLSSRKDEKSEGEIAAGWHIPPHPDPLPPGAREIMDEGLDRPLAMTSL
jgi:hypothetical protein